MIGPDASCSPLQAATVAAAAAAVSVKRERLAALSGPVAEWAAGFFKTCVFFHRHPSSICRPTGRGSLTFQNSSALVIALNSTLH